MEPNQNPKPDEITDEKSVEKAKDLIRPDAETNRKKTDKNLMRVIFIGFAVGILLGVIQANYQRTAIVDDILPVRTGLDGAGCLAVRPGCGDCPGEWVDGRKACNMGKKEVIKYGFPFPDTHETWPDSSYNVGIMGLNFLFLTFFTPALFVGIYLLINKTKDNQKSPNQVTNKDKPD